MKASSRGYPVGRSGKLVTIAIVVDVAGSLSSSLSQAFKVHNKVEFTTKILPTLFNATKYKSFQRNLNLWGFETISEGPHKGGSFHRLFVKGKPGKVLLCEFVMLLCLPFPNDFVLVVGVTFSNPCRLIGLLFDLPRFATGLMNTTHRCNCFQSSTNQNIHILEQCHYMSRQKVKVTNANNKRGSAHDVVVNASTAAAAAAAGGGAPVSGPASSSQLSSSLNSRSSNNSDTGIAERQSFTSATAGGLFHDKSAFNNKPLHELLLAQSQQHAAALGLSEAASLSLPFLQNNDVLAAQGIPNINVAAAAAAAAASSSSSAVAATAAAGGIGNLSLPEKLHHLLGRPELCKDCVSWTLDRRCIRIINPLKFQQIILPTYFGHSSYPIFVAELEKYGFARVTREGHPECYTHDVSVVIGTKRCVC